MNEGRLFPVSIVDDVTYCVDKAYPSLVLNYAWILTLEGEISTETALKALDKTMDFYPKSRCTITDEYPSFKRRFRYMWKLSGCTAGDIFREISLPDADSSIEQVLAHYVENHAALAMDIASHIPLKVLLIRQPGRAFLFLLMHHAAADGLGGFFFIQQFIRYYEDILYGRKTTEDPAAPFQDIPLPDVRFRWGDFTPRSLRPFLQSYFLMLREPALNVYPGKTKTIIGKFNTTVRDIPPDRLAGIRGVSKQCGSTVNDYLLAAMFQAVKKWSREWTAPSDRIYITVPMSLRPPEDRTLSNILSGVTISLNPSAISTKEAMLPAIRKEIATLAERNVARTLIHFSSLVKPLPIALRTAIMKNTAPGFAPTIVLSNMGVLSPNPEHRDEDGFHYMGSARIRDVYGIPAVGAWPMLLLYTYNNRMIFNMSFLDSYFSAETAGRFINAYLEEL